MNTATFYPYCSSKMGSVDVSVPIVRLSVYYVSHIYGSSLRHKCEVKVKLSAIAAFPVSCNYFISKPYPFLNTLLHILLSCNDSTGDQSTAERIFSPCLCNPGVILWTRSVTLYNPLAL